MSSSEHTQPESSTSESEIRLQKALAHAGVASRRACEVLIASGRVRVNGKVCTELGTRINPQNDEVRVDGVVVQLDAQKRYFVLNKPRGVVSSLHDEQGRRDLREFTAQFSERIYNVGRLDAETSGLLILTNDGELAHKLSHPSFGVQKTYVARVRGRMNGETVKRLLRGIELDDGEIHADRCRIMGQQGGHTLVEVTLHSGRNRIVRRMLAAVGHPVEELVRRSFGPLHLGSLGEGQLRELSDAERGALLTIGELPQDDRRVAKRARQISAGRPGDGAGARGMRGVAKRGNPHGRRGGSGGASLSGDSRRGGAGRAGGAARKGKKK